MTWMGELVMGLETFEGLLPKMNHAAARFFDLGKTRYSASDSTLRIIFLV